MKFKDLPPEKKYEMYQAYSRGEINSPEDLAQFYPKEAPKGLQTVDAGLSATAKAVNENPLIKLSRKFDQDFQTNHPYLSAPENIAKSAMELPGKAMTGLMDAVGIPQGPGLDTLLPKTVEETGVNPHARDLLPLITMEGLGYVGKGLRNYGTRGAIRAFEDGKPPLPPSASKEMAGDILDKNYLPHQEAASDIMTDAMLKLRERGVGASNVAREAADAGQRIPISPSRIRQFNSIFPEHAGGRNLVSRLEASQRGEITPDFVESKPGYTHQEKILNPSEVTQVQAPQGDLFDQDYYANPDAHSKPVPDFVAHPERGVFPATPELQKPIEPELAGSATKTPANYEFKETEIPPEGDYKIHPDSLYDMFSYANKNKHKAFTRDPITQQVIAKDPNFGEMLNGLRKDLRSDTTPLSEGQIQSVKSYDPEFEGKTVGEAVGHLNGVTSDSIGSQQRLGKPGVKNNPLSFMEGVYSNPDKRAFAQKLSRDAGLQDILDFADKYGSSKEHAEALSRYAKEGVSGGSFNPDKFAKHILYGGVGPALSLEAGKIIGSPARRFGAAKAIGSALEPLQPSNLWNKVGLPNPEE